MERIDESQRPLDNINSPTFEPQKKRKRKGLRTFLKKL